MKGRPGATLNSSASTRPPTRLCSVLMFSDSKLFCMARTYIAMASDVTDAVETTLSTMPLAVASSAKELRLILATTLQEFIWEAYMARMIFVSSKPVSATKASMSVMRSSLSSSASAPSPWMTNTPGNFSLISWQRAALLSITVTRFWMSCNSLTR